MTLYVYVVKVPSPPATHLINGPPFNIILTTTCTYTYNVMYLVHMYYTDGSVLTRIEQPLVMVRLNLNANVFMVLMVSCVVADWLMVSKHGYLLWDQHPVQLWTSVILGFFD